MKRAELKKIISLSLALGAAAVLPSALNLNTVTAEAAESYKLDDLSVDVIDGSSDITLYEDDDYDKSDKIEDDDYSSTMYAHISSNKKGFSISRASASEGTVKLYVSGSEVKKDEEIRVSQGNSKTVTIKILDDNNNVKKTYKLKVERYDDDDDDDDDDDEVYLDYIELDSNLKDIDFDFRKKTKNYDITVKNDITYVKVTAEPEDDDDTVFVNGDKVTDDDDWRSKGITLNEGENTVTVKVKDDDSNSRTYTLNITREKADGSTNTSSTSSTNSISSTENKQNAVSDTIKSGWQMSSDGKWHVYNVNGQICKNAWYIDPVSHKNFYLDADGNTLRGWNKIGNNMYYFDPLSGEKKTGWINLEGIWYHLDNNGVLIY